ncbi:hypothetical protein GPECTOR_2g935 [Gonium pectorale]|uniref:Uncharacterized protein n=1 Tax=Gonium pectorale TaxID=33097 RepID=A0A150H210_GONPE|nr:hypothetical protein GPECTOR_2g935 [Gonium pectorale]|eukprot:KXZ56053.1 hypothetical protein GPECTOR_2g935 [Gonium pectorale]
MSADAVPAKLLKVTVHGATLASLLYAVTAGGAPCDGLVFDPATVTESRAAIASTMACAAGCSFYDEAGQLDGEAAGRSGR